jgi:protein TonB
MTMVRPGKFAFAARAALAAIALGMATAASAQSADAKVVSRVEPGFPREASQAGVDNGMVKARMTIDSGGNVTRVDIVEAKPMRVFDRAVVRALSGWRFSEGAGGRVVETEVEFKR